MRRVSIAFLLIGLLLTLLAGPVTAQDSLRLTGSGATFPFPLYSAWFKSFSSKQKSVTVDYVRMLSKPQLFIEGNHRTGALVMSSILLRDGQPPFVLSVENAAAYFEPSAVIRDIHKHSPGSLFRAPGIRRRLAALLREHADSRYLLV